MIADPSATAGLYHPASPGGVLPVYVAVRLNGNPESFAPRLRAIAAGVDPSLQLHEIMPLDKMGSTLWLEFGFLFRLLVIVSGIALLLSLAGIYSVMSFTVSRRTREIGIRLALGADSRRIVSAIFWRPLSQVLIGVAAGGLLTAALAFGVLRGALWPAGAALVVGCAVVMMAVCLLACIVPTRRALQVEPAVTLRADA